MHLVEKNISFFHNTIKPIKFSFKSIEKSRGASPFTFVVNLKLYRFIDIAVKTQS